MAGRYPEPKFDYERDLSIDKNALDEELLMQPQKMMRYSTAHAQAQFDRDRAKQSLDVAKANLDATIRKELTDQQVKFTEAVIDGRIKTSPAYLESLDRLQKAEYEVNITFSGVMAMNARRPVLEDLVRLYLNGYWSEPRARVSREMAADASLRESEATVLRSQPPEASKGAAAGAPAGPAAMRPIPKPPTPKA